MISRRHDKKEPGPFRGLAEYIAAAKEEGEKLGDLWIVNAKAGAGMEDLDEAIREVDAQQALNAKVRNNKSYHLIVSFREGEKPSPEALRDIERHFAEALGFADHPRVVGTHTNTDHFHMHIGYSRIHPTTYKAHSPSHDFSKLEKVSRAMEKKYGLKVDLGRADKLEAERKPEAARDMEANSWEQSFFGYVREHKEPLTKALDKAKNWQDLHDSFAKFDLILKKRGNGLVIGSQSTEKNMKEQHIKASDLDRVFSKAALEKRFGPFQTTSRQPEKAKPAKRYSHKPTTSYPGQDRLWRRYRGPRKKRPSLLYRGFKTWREFLTAEALSDPLAMAIIYSQRKIIQALTTLPASLASGGGPKKRRTSKQASRKQKAPERTYLTVPYTKKDEAKALGAKWDRKAKSWYMLKDGNKDLLKWKTETAEEMGAFLETALSEDEALQSNENLDSEGRIIPESVSLPTAEEMGTFAETALSEEEALQSNKNLDSEGRIILKSVSSPPQRKAKPKGQSL